MKPRIESPTTVGKLKDVFEPMACRLPIEARVSGTKCSCKARLSLMTKYEGAAHDDLLMIAAFVNGLRHCDL